MRLLEELVEGKRDFLKFGVFFVLWFIFLFDCVQADASSEVLDFAALYNTRTVWSVYGAVVQKMSIPPEREAAACARTETAEGNSAA